MLCEYFHSSTIKNAFSLHNNMYQQIIIANKEEDSSERIIEIF